MTNFFNNDAFYGELYLRYINEHGYPTNAERKKFNVIFYDKHENRIADRIRCSLGVAAFHGAVKRHKIPSWVKRDPTLQTMYNKAFAQYKEKYENGDVPYETPTQNKAQNTMSDLNISQNDISMTDVDVSLCPMFEVVECPDVSRSNGDEETKKLLEELMEEAIKEDAELAEWHRKCEVQEIVLAGRLAKLEEKIDKVQNGETTVEDTILGMKIKKEIDDSNMEEVINAMKKENEVLNERILHLERETAAKDTLINHWKRKYDESQNNIASRVLALRKDLTAARFQVNRMTEKIQLQEMVINDKERRLRLYAALEQDKARRAHEQETTRRALEHESIRLSLEQENARLALEQENARPSR